MSNDELFVRTVLMCFAGLLVVITLPVWLLASVGLLGPKIVETIRDK